MRPLSSMEVKADSLLEWKSTVSNAEPDGRETSFASGNTLSSVESLIRTSSVAKPRDRCYIFRIEMSETRWADVMFARTNSVYWMLDNFAIVSVDSGHFGSFFKWRSIQKKFNYLVDWTLHMNTYGKVNNDRPARPEYHPYRSCHQ